MTLQRDTTEAAAKVIGRLAERPYATVEDKRAAEELRQAEADRQAAMQAAREALNNKATPLAIQWTDCRTFGHSWVSIEAKTNPAIGWYMVARCERCGTVRNDIVNRYGVVERRRYEYPDSYKDTDHWSRSDWRIQFLRRLQR